MVVMDTSENSRNRDYTPTRYEAQADAVSVIFSVITQTNGGRGVRGVPPHFLATFQPLRSKRKTSDANFQSEFKISTEQDESLYLKARDIEE
jgi:hypothetical protein